MHQFHLKASLRSAGTRGKNVEDHLASVEDFELRRFFQVADLRRRQVVVEEDHVGVSGLDLFLEFGQLALTDIAGGIGF